ncbi:hypothetical protein ElyMa_003559100 [Elysia marginata]|uniref:Uncharacterized protein n=1 Tax=Elysia marginata TaxID=1093978 RepID=A0AAV4EK95_9GAST|nr:hypothetical protein ElyMa_003559100 [Elysia marginata]
MCCQHRGEVELQIESLCSLLKSTLTVLQRLLEEFLPKLEPRTSTKTKTTIPYCGEFQAQFVRHLKRHHRSEDAVSADLDLPVVEQRRAFAQIRKQGIYEKNLSLLQQGKPSRLHKQLTEKQLQIWLFEPNSLFTPPTSIFRKPLEAEFDDELSASVGRWSCKL